MRGDGQPHGGGADALNHVDLDDYRNGVSTPQAIPVLPGTPMRPPPPYACW